MTIPNDIIENILQRRDVYILNYYEPTFDTSKWKCLGVYNTKLTAMKVAARIALESIESFNLYDPAKRFYQKELPYSEEKIWEDRWLYSIGICVYTVETRRLDTEGTPSETLYFNFDVFMKRFIVEHNLMSRDARLLLHSWKNDPPYELLLDLFSKEEDIYTDSNTNREAWLEKHGCVSHYPYGEYDPI